MKKKVFSLMAVIMFMNSSLTMHANVQNEDLAFATCYDIAAEAESEFMQAMLDKMKILPASYVGYLVFAAAYDACNEAGGQ